MRHSLRLAARYLLHHRVRTIVLVLAIALVLFLPVAVNLLTSRFERTLLRRADEVPLLVGARGSRYDLLLSSLYHRGRMRERLKAAEVGIAGSDGLASVAPVLVEDTAQGLPLVGTTLDYFERLGRRLSAGGMFATLGDAVLGSEAARVLGAAPGARVVTDTRTVYDLAGGYPLRLHVTGVLAPSGSPDDRAVFVDVKTAWVVQGIGHGHADVVTSAPEAAVIERRDGQVVVDSSVPEATEITPQNLASFHFHGDPDGFPLTALLVWPRDAKSATVLKGRYAVREDVVALVPREVVEELLGFVFRLKRFLDANAVLVAVATALFLGLVVVLTLRLRQREIETLWKIGCARGTVLAMQATELLLVLFAGAVVAALGVLLLFATGVDETLLFGG